MTRLTTFVRILLPLLAVTSAVPAAAQRFETGEDQQVLTGDAPTLVLTGLPPGALVDIRAERSVEVPARITQRSLAQFRVDDRGRIDLSTATPVGGSYADADASGLLWSMEPAFRFSFGPRSNEYRLTAFLKGRPVAATKVTFVDRSPGVTVEKVDAFQGAFIAKPAAPGRHPAIIVLGGSEGADYFARSVATRLASEGYTVLGLPYYSPIEGPAGARFPDLPATFVEIPVDRLDQVGRWLRSRPDVDPSRIALYGQSKGAELSLIAATRFPWISAVAAIVPSDLVRGGWNTTDVDGNRSSFSFRGKPLPFMPYAGMREQLDRFQFELPGSLRSAADAGRRAHPELAAAARIPVERFRGALLVAGGMDDAIWASATAVQNIAETRAAAGLATTALIFDDAGHGLPGPGGQPGSAGLGGTAAGSARAQRDTWAATLKFFRDNLQPEVSGG